MLETFGSDCIVTGQKTLLRKVFKVCEKKEKQQLLARDYGARAHKISICSVSTRPDNLVPALKKAQFQLLSTI